MADDLFTACAAIGLNVNVTKTKWLSTEDAQHRLHLCGETIERVTSFIYLGQLVNWPRDHNKEISRRLAAGWATFSKFATFFTAPRIAMRLKRRLFHQCVLPAMLYGCETWALTKAMEDRLAKAQRRMERRILRVRLRDRRPNTLLRGITKLHDIVECARRRKWRFAAKVAALDATRWTRTMTSWTPDATRPVGRPRRRWADELRGVAGSDWLRAAVLPSWNNMESRFVCKN
uniref:Endonuclease-reverse transcriptase n=1 Tax=Plectus sambesii TaxID=2011161 RepID=A0A914WBV8_9BILA